MSKITLNTVGSIQQNPTTATNTINTNFATVQSAMDNTLSRDGTNPNVMETDLDMNSNAILNLPIPSNDSEPLRLADLKSFTGSGFVLTKDPDKVYASDYGVKGDGGTYTTQGQNAINAAAGKEIVWPAGIIGTAGWTYTPSAAESPGLQMTGQGPEVTEFLYTGSGGYLLTANTAASSEFEYFLKVKNCRFSGAGVSVGKINYSEFDNCYFRNIIGDGLHFTGGGDPDSSSDIVINKCFFSAMTGWGVYAVPSGSNTEISNLNIRDTDFFACGTSSTSVPPTSGGVAWRGIQGTLDNVAFTECQNVGLYVAQSGTAQQLILRTVDFENCESTVLPSFYCDTGLRICRMENIQFLQGNAPLTNIGGVKFTSTISNLTIDGVTVRVASANNPWTGFWASGTPITDTNRIRNVWWQTFDGTGQNRYIGFTFDPISGQGQFLISALNTAKLRSTGVGATMPMYLGGANGFGEYVPYQIPSGGVTTSIGPLSNNTTYYFYLYNSADVNTTITGAIVASTTAPTTTFPGGYQTKTGDPSMIFIGQWTTDGSGNFQTGGSGSSWYPALNATLLSGSVGTVLVGQGASTTPVFTRSPQLGTAGSAAGSLIFANATSGTITVVPPAGALGSVTNTLQAVTDTVVYKTTTDTLTNKTLTSPTLTAPILGTPASGTLTNCTGLPNAGLVNSSITVGTTAISLGGSSTTLAGLTSVSSTNYTASGALTFQSNGSTFAGDITTGQQWFIGSTLNTPPTGPQLTVSKNISALPATGLATGNAVMTLGGVDAAAADINIMSFGVFNSAVRYFMARGTAASPTAAQSGDVIGANFSYGYYTSGGPGYKSAGGFAFTATENYTSTNTGMRIDLYATPTGTTGIAVGASIGAGVMVGDTIDPGAGAITATGLIKSKSATAGIGYATGAGGTVTQATSRTTGVTLNKVSGSITLFSQVNSAVSAATAQTFTLTNSAIAATDVVHVTQQSGTDKYEIFVNNTAAGSCQITNYTTGGTTNEAPVFNFVVIKGVTS